MNTITFSNINKKLQIIKKKDKIFKKIEQDLEKRFLKSLKELQNHKIADYDIVAKVEVFDTLLGYEPILTVYYSYRTFKDKGLYGLNIFGLDLKVGKIYWYLIDKFGLKNIDTKFYFWSEIEMKNQKYFLF